MEKMVALPKRHLLWTNLPHLGLGIGHRRYLWMTSAKKYWTSLMVWPIV